MSSWIVDLFGEWNENSLNGGDEDSVFDTLIFSFTFSFSYFFLGVCGLGVEGGCSRFSNPSLFLVPAPSFVGQAFITFALSSTVLALGRHLSHSLP